MIIRIERRRNFDNTLIKRYMQSGLGAVLKNIATTRGPVQQNTLTREVPVVNNTETAVVANNVNNNNVNTVAIRNRESPELVVRNGNTPSQQNIQENIRNFVEQETNRIAIREEVRQIVNPPNHDHEQAAVPETRFVLGHRDFREQFRPVANELANERINERVQERLNEIPRANLAPGDNRPIPDILNGVDADRNILNHLNQANEAIAGVAPLAAGGGGVFAMLWRGVKFGIALVLGQNLLVVGIGTGVVVMALFPNVTANTTAALINIIRAILGRQPMPRIGREIIAGDNANNLVILQRVGHQLLRDNPGVLVGAGMALAVIRVMRVGVFL